MIRTWLKAVAALALFTPALSPAQVATPQQPAPAQPSAPQAEAPAPAPIEARPALWEVSDEDTTVYLFGTIHVLKPGVSWFDDAVRKAFDASDELVLEMVTPDPKTMQVLIQRYAINTGGPALPEKLSADKRDAYLKALSSLGLPANSFDRTDPWFASTNLALLPIIKLGYDPAQGVDEKLNAAAKEAKKPVSGLETAEQQLGFMDAIPDKAQVAMLNSTVADMPRIQPMIETMVGSWSQGNPEQLAAVMNEGLREVPDVARILLTDRNARWAEWIDQRMDKPGTIFIAVGAGHLAGPDSVQAQLEKLKMKVRRVR